MECPDCGNTDLLPKFKCCPECGSKLPRASATEVLSSGTSPKDGREAIAQETSLKQLTDTGDKSELRVDKGRFEGDNSHQGETATVSKHDAFSAAQSDGHSSAAAINSDQSKNPPADKGQGTAERRPENPTGEGVKIESSILTESHSGATKPAAQKFGHVESPHGKSTGTTAFQVSPIQTLRAVAECDQNISSGSSVVAGKEVASLGDSTETSRRWHMASGHTQQQPLRTSEIQQPQQQTATHQLRDDQYRQQQLRPVERDHDPTLTQQQQQQRRQLPQRPQQDQHQQMLPGDRQHYNQQQQMPSADRQHYNQHQKMSPTDRQHYNQQQQMPSADRQHYNQQQQMPSADRQYYSQQQQMPSADRQHYSQQQQMPSADQQHYNQHQQMPSADWQHHNQHQKVSTTDRQHYNQHQQTPSADQQQYNQHKQMPPSDRQNRHQQMPPTQLQQYNQHRKIPPTGHQHYKQHQHLQQNQQKQPPPGAQVFDQQQQPSSSTKQQHQQVDRQQCLNAEAISEDNRAEGVHRQAARKAPGSTDPNKSSQASQNRRGRDDPTTQTYDQRTKMSVGGIEGKESNIVNEGDSRRATENIGTTPKEKVESTALVLSAAPEESARSDTVLDHPLNEQMNEDNGSETLNTRKDGHWYQKPAKTPQDAEAGQGKKKALMKKQGKEKGGAPSLLTAQNQHTLKQVDPEKGVTVVFHVLLESNFKMEDEGLHIRAGARDLGEFKLNCVDLIAVGNCKDKKKLMRFCGQFTLSVDCARQGTSYKYVVVKKGNVHWEGLPEFPSRYPGAIVNRFLSIPKKYLNPGCKL